VASLLGALRYRNTNTADPATAERTITITVVDGDGGSATAHTTVSVVAVNDAPSITGPSTLAVDEDGASPIDGFAFADPDAANAPVTLTLGVSSGTLHAAPAVGVARTGAGTATLMLEGDLDALRSALAAHAVTFSAATGDTADVTLTVTLHDHGNTGTGGPKTATLLVTLTVQPGAPAPPAQAPPPGSEPVPEEPATPPAAATPPPSAATTPPPPAAPATTAPAPVPDPQPLPEPAPVRPARDQSSGVPAPAVPDANAPMPAPVNAARASAEATVRRSHGVPAWPAAPIAGAFLLLLVVLVRRRRDDTAR
jgi:hypothetical protein